MALTFRDVSQLDNAFGNLDEALLRNRMMKQEQARQTQEQQRLQQNAAATQAYRASELDAKNRELTDTEQNQKLERALAQSRLDEQTRHDKADESNAENKTPTRIYMPNGESVTVPKSTADAMIAANPDISLTNKYEKTLNVNGVPFTYHNEKEYNNAALKWQQHQDTMAKGTAPKTTTTVKTGMEGGFPINETNTVTTATAPLSGPAPTAQPSARVKVKDSSGKMFTVPQEQLQDAINQGYSQVQ